MSSNQVTITITATDGSSQVFKAIASSAQGMGTAVSTAGNTASTGLAKLDSAASKTSSTLKTLASGFSAVGKSSLVSFLNDSTHAAADAQVQNARLAAAFEAVGKSAADYSDQISAVSKQALQLGFDDDKAAEAIARLVQTTGSADDSLQALGAAEDLARARGIDLVDAAQLVGRAYDGNVTALQRMGIALDKGASGMAAVDAIQQRFAGNADAYANTLQGAFERGAVALENFQEAVGGAAEPFARLIQLVPGLATGFSGVVNNLDKIKSGFTGVAGAIGPVALGFVGLGVAVAAGVAEYENIQGKNAELTQSLQDLQNTVNSFSTEKMQAEFQSLGKSVDDLEGHFRSIQSGGLQGALEGIGTTIADPTKAGATAAFNESLSKLGQTIQNVGGQDANLLVEGLGTIEQNMLSGKADVESATDAFKDMNTILNASGPAGEVARAGLDLLVNELNTGQISQDVFDKKIHEGAANISEFAAQLEAANPALAQQAAQTNDLANRLAHATDQYGPLIAAQKQYQANNEAALQAAVQDAQAGQAQSDRQLTYTKALQTSDALQKQWTADVLKSAESNLGYTQSIQGAAGALAQWAKPGQTFADELQQLSTTTDSINSQFAVTTQQTEAMAQSMNNALSSLTSVENIFKELDTIGKASADAKQIAQGVVGDPGVYAAVDDALQQGLILRQNYDAAQAAEVRIVQDDAAVQNDLNGIRANSVPLLAQQEDGLRAVLDQLAQTAKYNPALAQQSLYLMDSGNAAKVSAAYSTAYAEALGQIPPEVATQIIANAANADPILKDILEKYGLVKEGADGTITVNFPEKATLDDVTTKLDTLNSTNIAIGLALTGDVAGAKAILDRVQAATANTYTVTLDAVDQASAKLNPPIQIATSFDGKTYTGALAVLDNASQPIANVAGAVRNIDNTTATVTVDANVAPFEASIAGLGQNVKPIEIPVVPMQQGVVGVQYTAPKEAPSVQAPAAPPPVPITADISPFDASLQTAEAEGANFAQQIYQAHLGLDLTQFNTQLPGAITDAAGFASQTYQAKLSADSGEAAAAIQTAIQEGEGFARQTYTATLSAQDNTGDVLVNASTNAHAFANAEYQASLTANDAASSVIAIPQAAATAFATTYTGTLETTDNASNVITTATGLALAFATTYSADLECVDNASGVINEVVQELDNVDGKTATTYINTVNTTSDGGPMHAGGGQLGKTIQAMALGGTASGIPVLVGEAGPEIAFLPLGTQVIPHGASVAAMQGGGTVGSTQSSLQPNTAQATSAGQKDGVAYYQGLLSAVKSQKQTLHGEIFGNTLFTSAAAAKPGLDALSNLGQQHDQLVQKLQEARQDQQQLGNAATKAGTSMTTAATSATTAIQGTTQATGKLATMIGKLQGLHSLVGGSGGGSGAVDPIKQAIQSFEQTALSSLGQVQQASQDTGQALNQDIGKGATQAAGQVSNATGQMSSDLSQLPKDAKTSGTAAGNAIGQGLSQGIQKSNVSDQISGVQQQLQQLGSTTQGPSIGVNDQQAQQGIQGVQQGLSQLNGQNAAVGVDVNTSQWDKFVQNFKSMDGQSVSVTVNQKTNTSGGGGGGGGGGGKTPPPSGQGGGGGGGGKNPPPSGQTPASLNLPLSALVPQAALGRTLTVLPGVPPPVSATGTNRPTQFVNYGHIHIHPHTADLYQEITGAFAQMGRW